MLRKFVKTLCIALCVSGLFSAKAYAAEATYEDAQIDIEGFSSEKSLTDDNTNTFAKALENNKITISREDGIGGIYIKFDRVPAEWAMEDLDSGEKLICGENGFLHEYINVTDKLEGTPGSLVLTFEEGTVIADIYAFSEGEIPAWVQIWQPPCEAADLLLVSSHADDEQLFFLGVLPYYAGELGLKVQVAYVVQHFEANGVLNHQRPHEQLDGLWTVGVKNYPVMSDFPDLYAQSKDRQVAFSQAEAVFESAGVTYEDFVAYMEECIERFKPLVIISHDLDGEYGHGTHVLAAAALTEAVKKTDSVEKLYLHLYEENTINMDYDVPLEAFGGKTAYEVSCDGFACHESQHWTWFYKWIYGSEENPITKASQIRSYSPCKYGLYYTRVGVDTTGGDFFENVDTYGERIDKELKELKEQLTDVTDESKRGVFR